MFGMATVNNGRRYQLEISKDPQSIKELEKTGIAKMKWRKQFC